MTRLSITFEMRLPGFSYLEDYGGCRFESSLIYEAGSCHQKIRPRKNTGKTKRLALPEDLGSIYQILRCVNKS
jgi:hypothetical protein